MAVGAAAVNVTVVGVNVPPPLPLLGVTTMLAPTGPLAPTVKFVDVTLTPPEFGPVRVMETLIGAFPSAPPPQALDR